MNAAEAPGDSPVTPFDMASALALVDLALAEDLGPTGDLTSRLTIPPEAKSRAALVAREAGVVFGLAVAELVFQRVDDTVRFVRERQDGDPIGPGDVLARVDGSSRSLLSAERTALNFLQRLSGIATLTRRHVERLDGTGVRLLDTRKTTPGLRFLEKAAVRAGGGHNHRHGLHDMILIKDNHIVAAGGIASALRAARQGRPPGVLVEVEVARVEDLETALAGKPDGILLDNMTPEEVKKAVVIVKRDAVAPWVEVSGGITLETLRSYAIPGVDFISSGGLTHSAPSLDLALEFESLPRRDAS